MRLDQVPQVPHLAGPGVPGSAALRQRLRLVVAGNVGAAIKDLGVALGDGAVKCDGFRVEIAVGCGSDMKWRWRSSPRTRVALSSPASCATIGGR